MTVVRPHHLLDLLVRLEDDPEHAWMLRSGGDLFRAAADGGLVDLRAQGDYDDLARAMTRLMEEGAVRLADHYAAYRAAGAPFDGNALMNARDIEVTTPGRVLHRNLFGADTNRSEMRRPQSASAAGEAPRAEEEFDFFVSYTSTDEEIAEWIAWALEEEGHKVRFQKWDFVAGSNFVLEMDRATRSAKRTILVLSKAVVEKPFPASEWAAAFAADPAGWSRKLVPVRVDDVHPTGLLAQITYIDLVGLTKEKARVRLVQGLRDRAKPDLPPGYPASVSTAPGAIPTSVDVPTLDGFVTPEGGRPDRSSFNGVGIMRLHIAPLDSFAHPDGVRVGGALEAATREAANAVNGFVRPDLSPRLFDWIQRFTTRGSVGWASGHAADDFETLSKHVLAAVTYIFTGSSLSFLVSMGVTGEGGHGKVAFEHIWAAELIGSLLLAGHFYAAADEATPLRVDIAVQGLDGAVAWADSRGRAFAPDQPQITDPYYEERRLVYASDLRDRPDEITRELLDRLFVAIDRGQDVVGRVKP